MRNGVMDFLILEDDENLLRLQEVDSVSNDN